MKKVLTILTICLSLAVTSSAQKKALGTTPLTGYFVKAGVELQSNTTFTTVELGKQFGTHSLSVTANMSNTQTKAYAVGLEYGHRLYQAGAFNFGVGGTVSMDLNRFHSLTFSPKADAGLKLGFLNLEATLATPIYESTTLFKPTYLRAGLKVGVTL